MSFSATDFKNLDQTTLNNIKELYKQTHDGQLWKDDSEGVKFVNQVNLWADALDGTVDNKVSSGKIKLSNSTKFLFDNSGSLSLSNSSGIKTLFGSDSNGNTNFKDLIQDNLANGTINDLSIITDASGDKLEISSKDSNTKIDYSVSQDKNNSNQYTINKKAIAAKSNKKDKSDAANSAQTDNTTQNQDANDPAAVQANSAASVQSTGKAATQQISSNPILEKDPTESSNSSTNVDGSSSLEDLEKALQTADDDLKTKQSDLQTATQDLENCQNEVNDIQQKLEENENVASALKNNTEMKALDTQIETNKNDQTKTETAIQTSETQIQTDTTTIATCDSQITQLNSEVSKDEYTASHAMKTVTTTDKKGNTITKSVADEDARAAAQQAAEKAKAKLTETQNKKTQATADKEKAEKEKADEQKQLTTLKATQTDLQKQKTTLLTQITQNIAQNNQEVADLRSQLTAAQNKANDATQKVSDAQDAVTAASQQKESIQEKVNTKKDEASNPENMKKIIAGTYGKDALNKDGINKTDWDNPDSSTVTATQKDGKTVYTIGGIEIDENTLKQEALNLASKLGESSSDLSMPALLKLDLADGKADGHISSDVNDYNDYQTDLWNKTNDSYNPQKNTKNFFEATEKEDKSGEIVITNRGNKNQADVNLNDDSVTFGMSDSQDTSIARTIQDQNGWVNGGLKRKLT